MTKYSAWIVGSLVMLSSVAQAQWKDKRMIGQGGETSITTDGHGNVYATCHLPSTFFVSRDWGDTFEKRPLKGFCDYVVEARPDGRVYISCLDDGVTGITIYHSTDSGKTLQGGTVLRGPLDREWLGIHPQNGEVYVNYSHGYIGGPKSTGIFLAASKDGGKTFEVRSRIDKDRPPDYPVDPYLTVSSDGKIYAMWATSSDYNTIDSYRFAVSLDGGRTFVSHQTLARTHPQYGDVQERWMLGCLVAVGKEMVVAFYQDRAEVPVNGKVHHPHLVYYRVSRDGGKSFSPAQTVVSKSELEEAIRQYVANKKSDTNLPEYLQTLPWSCVDPAGRVHVIWQDNRSGQGLIDQQAFNRWHVRYAMSSDLTSFGKSERVSEDVTCKRPPLDFMSCAADRRFVYVIWTETPNSGSDWNFSGTTYVARKPQPFFLAPSNPFAN